MASSPKQPGFLTKMVGLIRASAKEPAPHDGDSVHSRHAADQALEKEAIREHIERRRRDDRIRRREFNYLRKVRAEGLTAFPSTPQRPSVFQNSSSFNPDAVERSRTVRKIDAIEAQMSTQWAASKIAATQPPKSAPAPARTPRSTRALPLQPVAVAPPPAVARELPPLEMEMELDLDFTGLLAEEGHATLLTPIAPVPVASPAAEPDSAKAGAADAPSAGTVALAEHPVLQEAATCFAAGDNDAAEAALLSVLESPESGDAAAEACSAGLLDLYRATGQQTDFDVVAIEYAQLFGRSAPEWFAVDEVEATRTGALEDDALLTTDAPAPMGWTCPARLTRHETAALQATAGRGAPALHWDALEEVAPECIAPLRVLFQAWANTALELQFSGVDVLLQVLAQATVMEDRSVDPAWWNLRLEVLRTLNQAAAFEEVALDFCVTYEVSPPSWVPPRCSLVGASPVAATYVASVLAPLESVPESRLSLSGVLEGDASLALAQMLKRAPLEDPLIVSCARLVRVDFVAAVSILNWVTNVTASGRDVQFVHVPRLLAAYFDVVGISAQAGVLTGKY